MIPKITLEQWAAFKAVVDEGSHAAAAEALSKSQSTISYLLARLNEQLPSPALRVVGRKAELTKLGKTLYRHATNLLDQAAACEQTAQFAASGWENELRLACDALTPLEPVMCALQAFSSAAPQTRIKILETTLSGTDEAILSHQCDMAIAPRVPPGFLAKPLTQVTMVAVASVDHPLAKMAQITEAELKTHRQIVIKDSGIKREQDAGWLGAEQRWTVSHFATSVEMVAAALGFAFIPLHRVQPLITQKKLALLNIEAGGTRVIPLNLIQSKNVIGPGAQLLTQKLQSSFAKPSKQGI